MNSLRTTALLSIQRALWDRVTPNLRGVAVSWPDDVVTARFIYDSATGDLEFEMVNDAEGEVAADLPAGHRTNFTLQVETGDHGRELSSDEWWAYLRHEPAASGPPS